MASEPASYPAKAAKANMGRATRRLRREKEVKRRKFSLLIQGEP